MLFSIIVPIYKVERYLPECIDSILSQEFRDFELILVDDGSPDQCPVICDMYAEKDPKVRVIHKGNGGVSDARNTGLSAAEGDYIVFVDGDDILCSGTLQKLSGCIQDNGDADMIIGNIVKWEKGYEWIEVDNRAFGAIQVGTDILSLNERFIMKGAQMPWGCYHSVYRRGLLEDNSLLFQKGLVCSEDLEFYLRVIRYVKRYILTDISLIKYRQREDSVTHTSTFASVWGQLTVFYGAAEQADLFSEVELMQSYFANWYARLILWIVPLEQHEDRERCYRFVEEHWDVLSFTKGIQYEAAKAVWRIFGVRRGSEMLDAVKSAVKLVRGT